MKVKFWGVRGSIATPSRKTVEYGGNTSCVSAELDGHVVIFDSGTGIRPLGQYLASKSPRPGIDLFLSHVHWDHIQGFPFFAPNYMGGFHIKVHGRGKAEASLRQILAGQMEGPNFPISLTDLNATLTYRDLAMGKGEDIFKLNGVQVGSVTHTTGRHPNGVSIYRLTEKATGHSVVYATDTEHADGGPDKNIVKLAQGADVLIYDGMYTPEEYESKYKGWGHSTWEKGVEIAQAAGVKKLCIFHHDPDHDDEFLASLEKEVVEICSERAPALRVVFAREGMEIEP